MELKHVSALTPSTLQIYTGGEKSEQNLTQRDGKENKSQVSLGKKENTAVYISTWCEKQVDIHTGRDVLHHSTVFNPNA